MTIYIIKFYNSSFLAKLFWGDFDRQCEISANSADEALGKFRINYSKKYILLSMKGIK